MATGGEDVNVAFVALREHYEELLTAIQEPEALAAGLFTRGVVTKNLMDEVSVQALPPLTKKIRLLSFVADQIAVDPTNLDKFMGALKNQPSAVGVAQRLETTYCTLTGQPSTQPIRQGQVQPIIQQPTALNPSSHANVASVMQQLHVLSSPGQPASIPPAPSQQQPPSLSAIETYAYYLKFDVYLRQKFPTYGKWPPNKAKKFINLALIKKQEMSKEEMNHFTKQTIRGHIDDIVHEKESISMETIGQPKGKFLPKCILVEGAPGVGKSTFAWKLCRKWSKGKLLKQYRLVVLLRLRDKRVREAKSVSALFYYGDSEIQQKVVNEIRATGGRGVLLLFEGYDELPAKLRTTFLDIIKDDSLRAATFLITSRPSASGPLYEECRDFIDQHVEILGFTDENIQSYIESTTSHDPSLLQGLQQYLTYYPHIRPMLYIPLNCAIVVEVYRVHKSSKSLIPKTWTDLYSSLLRSLLLRYLDDHPVYQRQSWKSNSFRDLPADVYQWLCEVGRIAYEGILQDQQVIFSDLPSDFNSLGLMQCVPELYVDEVGAESFNFLHLTLQEYMAALHLSDQPVEKQIELFKNYQLQQPGLFHLPRNGSDQSHSHFWTVLRFLAGLGKFTGFPTASIRSLLANRIPRISSSDLRISLDGLHWMFEARCSSSVCEAIGMSVVGVVLSGTVTSFDCFVLGYCVSHSNCPWEVHLVGCGIGDEEVAMLVRGGMEGEVEHSGYISVMYMDSNNITSTGLNQLLKIPELLKLRELDLHANPLGRGGAISLLKSPLVDNLEELTLSVTKIGVEDCQALSNVLSASPTLQRINIGGNALPPEAVELIIAGLKNHTVLEELNIMVSHFNLQNCISLASATQPPRHLFLEYCHIDDEGAIEVATLLNKNSVTFLDLGENPINVTGARVFAEKLRHNTSLIELNLDCESIGLEGTQKLIDSLSQNSTLARLWLPREYQSAVSASEAYQRVKDRIEWGGPFQLRRRMKTSTISSEPLPATLEEGVEMSDSRILLGSTHQPHPPWLSHPWNPPATLEQHRGMEDPTHQPHPSHFNYLPQPWTPPMMLGPHRAAQATTGGGYGYAGPQQGDSAYQLHLPWPSHIGPSRGSINAGTEDPTHQPLPPQFSHLLQPWTTPMMLGPHRVPPPSSRLDLPPDVPLDVPLDIPPDLPLDVPLGSPPDLPLGSPLDIPLDPCCYFPLDSPSMSPPLYLFQLPMETDLVPSEIPPVTLPSSSGGVIDIESGTGEEQADVSMAVPARGEITEEEGVDSLDSEVENSETPPASPTYPGSVTPLT